MRIGIEVEFVGNVERVMEGLRAAGLSNRSQVHSYTGNSDSEWVVKYDGSVSNGGELVSPPMEFTEDSTREAIRKAIKVLQDAGCRGDHSAGIHVHVESRGMSAEQLANLSRTFHHFEDAIVRIGTSGWNSMRRGATSYALPLSTSQVRALARAKTEEQVRNAYYGRGGGFSAGHGHSSRYRILNLHSHFYRGTVEFRLFNSSVNPMRVVTYVALCHAIMTDAMKGAKRSVNKRYAIGDMAEGRADSDKVIFNFLTVLRYKADMSLEDYRNIKKLWKDSRPQRNWAAA
jgi:hypothetical protein